MTKISIHKLYAHHKQIDALNAKQGVQLHEWGRGTGKNHMGAVLLHRRAFGLPKSNGDIVSRTIKDLKNGSFPTIQAAWKQMGFYEHTDNSPGHYVLWKKPPHYWPRAWQEPQDYTNVISVFTGCQMELLGMQSVDGGRGPTSDWQLYDEFAFLNMDRVEKVFDSRCRGNKIRYEHKVFDAVRHMHRSKIMITSSAWNSNRKVIKYYRDMAKKFPEDYYYSKATVHDNVKILGQDYIDRMRRKNPTVFAIEYECQEIDISSSKYYSGTSDFHLYSNDVDFVDPFYDSSKALELYLDFNAGFECGVVAQPFDLGLAFQKEFYTHKTVEFLADEFDEFYTDHSNRVVILDGDRGGLNRRGTKDTYFDQIELRLSDLGWHVIRRDRQVNPPHLDKYLLHRWICQAEELGRGERILRYNQDGCPSLIRAMALTNVLDNYKKDKKPEKSKQNRHLHTHLPDAHDFAYWHHFEDSVDQAQADLIVTAA